VSTPSAALPPQLTFRAITLAIVLAMILAAANTYLGLFAGMTIASAIPAAVVSMAVLRALGGGGILENNIVQTGASAGSSIASGVIFTIPALVILGYWQDFKYSWVLAIAGLGGILGVLFSVPLRRALIVEQKLAFPEGQAAAEVLKTGENPSEGIRILGLSALGGAFAKLAAASGLRLIPDAAASSGFFGKYLAYFGTNLSPALIGVGYIVGLNVGIVVLAGAMLSWNIAIPVYAAYVLPGNAELSTIAAGLPAEELAGLLWHVGARVLASLAGLRRAQRPRCRTRERCGRCSRAHRAGLADEVRADRHRTVHAATGRALSGDRRQLRRQSADDRRNGGHWILVLLGLSLHGGSRGILQQPGVGHHHRHHPVLGGHAAAHDGPGEQHRSGRRSDDRRGGLLRRLHRRR
jgi:putative OPT family oligopeptide transporter